MALNRTAQQDWDEMSEALRAEVAAAVGASAPLFQPSPGVSREAVRLIRPGSSAMLYLRLAHGPRPGQDGDGQLVGIKLGPDLEHIVAERRAHH